MRKELLQIETYIEETDTQLSRQLKMAAATNEGFQKAPWACRLIPVQGGLMAFESSDEAETFKAQR